MPGLRFGLTALLLAGIALLALGWSDRGSEPLPETDSQPRLSANASATDGNPLLAEALDPAPRLPLDRISADQVAPAMSVAVTLSRQHIAAVARNPDPADFANTALALERAGQPVARVSALFHAFKQLEGDLAWRQLDAPISELLDEHARFIRARADLLDRLDAINPTGLSILAPEQRRLIDLSRQRLRDHGLGLDPDDLRRFTRNEQTLAELAVQFTRNLRWSTGQYELLLDSRQRLDGLPSAAITRARRDAADRGHDQSWALTLSTHSRFDVLRFSPDRELRRTIFTAWERRAGGQFSAGRGSSSDIMRRMLRLRGKQARLLGHRDHWHRILADSSAQTDERFSAVFDTIAEAAGAAAESEIAAIDQRLRAKGQIGPPRPWDWWYYREQSRAGAGSIREWFPLDAVRDSAFALGHYLWGVTFERDPELPVWHDDVEGFVVADAGGEPLGIVYLDLLHRTGKDGGAWMSILRPASSNAGPVVVAAANLDPATKGRTSLLTPYQVETVYHELGHVLQVLLSRVDHPSLDVRRVADDFIEVPALIFERFALNPIWVKRWARHIRSGQPLRSDQLSRLAARRTELAGIDTLQLLSAVALDRAWHRSEFEGMDRPESVAVALRRRFGWPAIITPRAVLGDYSELFAGNRGGRSYRRLWADVLAADAFAAMTSGSSIDRGSAGDLRRELLEPGNGRDPRVSWQRFRGRSPDPIHWLRERGLAD